MSFLTYASFSFFKNSSVMIRQPHLNHQQSIARNNTDFAKPKCKLTSSSKRKQNEQTVNKFNYAKRAKKMLEALFPKTVHKVSRNQRDISDLFSFVGGGRG